MKKIARNIIILNIWTKKHDHIKYAFWDIEWDRQTLLLFWADFALSSP